MTYALDANTPSFYMRREDGVVARFQAEPPQRIALPSLVVYELNYGLRREGRRAVLDAFARLVQTVAVLDFDVEAADHAARIRVELEALATPIRGADLLIAATARRYGCILVTHNTSEFRRVPGLTVED